MFEPELFGLSSPALWSLAQSLVTPTLGFLFLYLMRLPLAELSFLPKTQYTPPVWVVPFFAHGSTFVLVALLSANLFLNWSYERERADGIKPELFLVRELDTSGQHLVKVAVVVKSYDGLSGFRVLANGYDVFSSGRNCVTSFQCTATAAKAENDAREFIMRRLSGGSVFELNKTDSLPKEIAVNHYLASGQNYLDVVSENSGTGLCELSVEIDLAAEAGQYERYLLEIHPYRDPRGDEEPKHRGPLLKQEVFYSGGTGSGSTVPRYKTSAIERRNSVCEKIRISLNLTEPQARALSSDADFAAYFVSRQKEYVCETIGKPIPGCRSGP